MEKDFRAKEAFVAHVDVECCFTDSIDSSVLFDPFARIRVVLCKLFHNVWTDVTVALLQKETHKIHTDINKKKHKRTHNKAEILTKYSC